MATSDDDDDESLARFLESEVLSEFSDQEEEREEQLEDEDDDRVGKRMLLMEDDSTDEVEEEKDAKTKLIEDDISEEVEMRKEEEENEEEEEKQVNKMLIEEGGISCEDEDNEEGEEREAKRRRIEEVDSSNEAKSMTLSSCKLLSSNELAASSISKNGTATDVNNGGSSSGSRPVPGRMETGNFSKVPPELFRHILKFLSSEDLAACSLVCRFLHLAASDESLWRRLYCMRWGLLPPKKLRECAWKKLYIQRDEEDMVEVVRNCPSEFKEYYMQMQAAKRSQTPLPSQVLDDRVIIDKTVTDQVSTWKSSRGLSDKVVADHACSGETCTYHQIGDVFVCEKTGNVHVCDDTCKEIVADPANELLVCTISGRCFDRLLSPAEMEPDEQQQGGVTDEAEPFMGSGRFARAYLLGYNCADEKELEATWRFC